MGVAEFEAAIASSKEEILHAEKRESAEMVVEQMLNIIEEVVGRDKTRLDATTMNEEEDRREDKAVKGTIIIITSKAPNATMQMTSRKKKSALKTK